MELLNPTLQLKRGFAIATDTDHNIIFSSDQVNKNEIIQLQVSKGTITKKVIKGKTNNA